MDTNPIADEFAARINEHSGPGFITGWVAVIEWCDHEGNFSAITLRDDVSPPWRIEGLLTAATIPYLEVSNSDDDDEVDD